MLQKHSFLRDSVVVTGQWPVCCLPMSVLLSTLNTELTNRQLSSPRRVSEIPVFSPISYKFSASLRQTNFSPCTQKHTASFVLILTLMNPVHIPPHTHISFNIHFNIILWCRPTLMSFKWARTFTFEGKKFICCSSLQCMLLVPRISSSITGTFETNLRNVQIINFPIPYA